MGAEDVGGVAEALQTHPVSFGPVLWGCCVHARRDSLSEAPAPPTAPGQGSSILVASLLGLDSQAAALGRLCIPAGNPGEG